MHYYLSDKQVNLQVLIRIDLVSSGTTFIDLCFQPQVMIKNIKQCLLGCIYVS